MRTKPKWEEEIKLKLWNVYAPYFQISGEDYDSKALDEKAKVMAEYFKTLLQKQEDKYLKVLKEIKNFKKPLKRHKDWTDNEWIAKLNEKEGFDKGIDIVISMINNKPAEEIPQMKGTLEALDKLNNKH